jgi:hypothetical protein
MSLSNEPELLTLDSIAASVPKAADSGQLSNRTIMSTYCG